MELDFGTSTIELNAIPTYYAFCVVGIFFTLLAITTSTPHQISHGNPPKTDAKVVVKEDCYEIDKDISKGDAIRIGRTLASGELGQYCLQRATLFIGHAVETEKKKIRNNKREE